MARKIILVKPRGLCAGVERALKILDLTVEKSEGSVYCRHAIVHNEKVVEEFSQKGVIFVEDLNQVPNGSVVVFSAHGSSPELFKLAKKKNLRVVDAVCPLVMKVHEEAKRFRANNYLIVYLGHKNHPEALGVLGEVPGKSVLISSLAEAKKLKISGKAVLLTQTTLGLEETKEIVDYLTAKFPNLELPAGKDICFSTTNRQLAVKELAKHCDLILVVGSKNSSNSNRLREVAGIEAYLVDGPEDLKEDWFKNKNIVGITAGASVPEKLVRELIDGVKGRFGGEEEELEVIKENIKFRL
ncbi:MAG: 4-hydroxy-3-methylbut-2-enyl diphosphate reductase [Candidatus Beckwithbacteria bacterium]|nr:4-hydroxy-3-methylbut-2-enyl diphosphate reductase [Candidatus Beckwithbacteria bacterium]